MEENASLIVAIGYASLHLVLIVFLQLHGELIGYWECFDGPELSCSHR